MMTNDEAIKTLREDYCGNRIICELYPDQCNREDCEIWLAIKALETQLEVAKDTNVLINDCISRQAAIEAVEHITSSMSVCVNTDECHGMKRMQRQAVIELANLPSAQSEPQWIPCSERMPEKYGNYLISIHGEDEPDIGTINPNDKRGWSLCDANGFYWASDKELIVTAWMPLPEPYRTERRIDGVDS